MTTTLPPDDEDEADNQPLLPVPLPEALPPDDPRNGWETARLPETFEGAIRLLWECTKEDECLNWEDERERLLSYTRQLRDDTPDKHLRRIRLRAKRCEGKLLIKHNQQGLRTDRLLDDGGQKLMTTAELGAAAGFSERGIKERVALAKVDDEAFDAAIESDNLPTEEELTKSVRKRRPKKRVAAKDQTTTLVLSDLPLSNIHFIWLALREFQRRGLLDGDSIDADPRELLAGATGSMCDDVFGLAPQVARYLNRLVPLRETQNTPLRDNQNTPFRDSQHTPIRQRPFPNQNDPIKPSWRVQFGGLA